MPQTFAEMAVSEPDGSLCFSLVREMCDVEVVARFAVDGEPVSKQRPRFSKKNGRVYTPERTRSVEQRVGWGFRQAAGAVDLDPAQSFGVYLGFFCGTGQRRDVDNMSKLVLNGLNGIAWADDAQVSEISAKVLRWQLDPRTEVVVYRTHAQAPPSQACNQCGKSFRIYPSAPDRRFCSNLCFYESRGGLGSATCQQCGTEFSVRPSRLEQGVVHCSVDCKREGQRDALVHLTCGYCLGGFSLRPSEFKRRPNARFCSGDCRNRARAKTSAGEMGVDHV